MAAACAYVSGACNQSPRCIDWWDDLICYGCCNSVLIYDPEAFNGAGIISHTLCGHKQRVNCVKWIRNSSKVTLVSGSVDSTVIVWEKIEENFKIQQILTNHKSAVTVVDTLVIQKDEEWTILVSTSADFTALVWERKSQNDIFQCTQTISFGNGFALDVKLVELPNSKVPLLALACDDSKIHLYTKTQSSFEKKLILTGHEDWVRGVDFTTEENGDLLLISSSQDAFLRLWRISKESCSTNDNSIKLKENIFRVDNENYTVMLESVMAGHENWVYSVHWQNSTRLISASMDKSLIIWELDTESNLWSEKVRVGDVGGNSLGFYDAIFSPNGKRILAHGYQGSFHMWNYEPENNIWEAGVALRGHFSEVLDICWDPNGKFLLSCSEDKTTRLHACWQQNNGSTTWHEIARPQIHGYEMTCLAMLGQLKFASGADEKIIRIFAAPRNFVDNFGQICKTEIKDISEKMIPEGASVPSLGLSNKAVFTSDLKQISDPDERHIKDQYPEFYFSPISLSEPPTEETLLQNTLWPEIQKLYGHGYEIYSLASNHSGTVLASASKASKMEHAAILLWDTLTWKQIGRLEFHTLTVTQMAFSPNDKYFVSVSRDRTWALYSKDETSNYVKIANTDKKNGVHSRIIWGCAWSHDSRYFATVSRDKKVAIWQIESENEVNLASSFVTEDSATTVDFAPTLSHSGRYIIGIGLQNGTVLVYQWKTEWSLCLQLDEQFAHHLTVKRLKFCPKIIGNTLRMATCGSDHLVRIYNINFSQIDSISL